MITEIPSTSPADQAIISKMIDAHLEIRKASWEKNVAKSKELFTIGTQLCRLRQYEDAANYYAAAYDFDITEPLYPASWAAVELKRQRYEQAEIAASAALKIQPRHVFARFQRIQARKGLGLYKSALQDARAWLRVEPDSTEADKEIRQLEVLLLPGVHLASSSRALDSDDLTDHPHENETPIEILPEDWSDSEDAIHLGNAIPCRFYNRHGCSRGEACKYSHGFDEFSVRDRVARNVCMFYLLGICKFGENCNYCHSKAALPENGWWNDPEKARQKAEALKSLGQSGFFRQEIVRKRKEWWRTTNKGKNPFKMSQYGTTRKERGSGIPPNSEYSGTKGIFGHEDEADW